jgi:hypothetical protein
VGTWSGARKLRGNKARETLVKRCIKRVWIGREHPALVFGKNPNKSRECSNMIQTNLKFISYF